MLQLSLEGYGSRRISRIIASEYGPECKYSHTHIQNFLNDQTAVSNPFPQNETLPQIVNSDPSFESAPVSVEQQVPPRYVPSAPYATVSPSTIIVPYPVPSDPPSPGDSLDHVFLDLIRANGMAAIQHRYQQQEAPVQPTENKGVDNFQSLLKDVKSYVEQQEKKQQEETARTLEAVQNEINEHRKRMEAETAALLNTHQPNLSGPEVISDITGTGTKPLADLTAELEPNLKETVENNQWPRIATYEGTVAGLVTKRDKKEADSTALTLVTVKSLEPTPTQINNSKNVDDTTQQAKKTEPLTTADTTSTMSPLSTPTLSIASTPDVRNNGFGQQPDSTESETHSKILEPDQRSVANNIPGYTPTTPTEKKDQLQFSRIQAAQDAGFAGGSHNGDDGSSTNQLIVLGGLSLAVLGLVCGIDYFKARANSKPSSQVNSYTKQQSTTVRGYSRVNDPNDVATF